MHSRRNNPGPPATQRRWFLDESLRRINEMLMLAKSDEFGPERLA